MTLEEKMKEIDELLTRGVGEFIDPDNIFKEKLIKKARGEYTDDLVIKFGVDPNRPDIHLGHAVILRKLRKFQELGCKVVFLVGDFTAQIGDPAGKSKVRPEVELQEVEKNVATYLDQVGKVLLMDPKVFSWIRNSDWFYSVTDLNLPEDYFSSTGHSYELTDNGKVTGSIPPHSIVGKAVAFEQTRMQTQYKMKSVVVVTVYSMLWSLKHFTHAQLIKRDMFADRLKSGEDLYMHEMLYPVFQGIDSYALNIAYGSCDLEVGGTDQTFNMLMGREVQMRNKKMLHQLKCRDELQAVLSFKLLVGTDGKAKMSKSLDNYIGITDEPADMFGKVMSIPDDTIIGYFELCTYTPATEIERLHGELSGGTINPKDIKMRLAREIVTIYHGKEKTKEAEHFFTDAFQKGRIPDDITQASVKAGSVLVDILLEAGLVESKSEFRRLVSEGAVKDADDVKIENPQFILEKDIVLKIGKRRFIKIDVVA